MKDNLFLKIVIFILLVTNFAMLTFLWTHAPHDSRNLKREIDDAVHFTKEQDKTFNLLRNKHHKRAVELYGENIASHQALNEVIAKSITDTTVINAAVNRIVETERAIEYNNVDHFQHVRAMLNSEQQPKFDKLLEAALNSIRAQDRTHK